MRKKVPSGEHPSIAAASSSSYGIPLIKDIVNKKNGFLIDVGDKSEAIKILNNLTENKYLQKNLMKSSYLESKNWKKEVIINKWLNILS